MIITFLLSNLDKSVMYEGDWSITV